MKKKTCRKCGGKAKKSKGFGNSYEKIGLGRLKVTHGTGPLVKCLKCRKCGHSWIPA